MSAPVHGQRVGEPASDSAAMACGRNVAANLLAAQHQHISKRIAQTFLSRESQCGCNGSIAGRRERPLTGTSGLWRGPIKSVIWRQTAHTARSSRLLERLQGLLLAEAGPGYL